MNKTWAGNTYRNVDANTTPVYSGSSNNPNRVVGVPNTTTLGGSTGGSGKSGKSGGSKKTGTSSTKTSTQSVSRTYSGGGGGSSSGGSDSAAMAEAYAKYLKKLMKQAKNFYGDNMNAINDAFNNAGNTLKTNYDSTSGQLKNQYEYQQGLINTDASDSMRQAYINSMLQKKDLGQKMSALGLNGGATETTLASMNNNYSNARNNIDTTRQRSLSDLDQTYQGNLADAMRQYNTAVNNLAMQRLDAEQAARQAYLNMAMQLGSTGAASGVGLNISLPKTNYDNTVSNQKAFTYTPTQAVNRVGAVNTVQNQSNGVYPATTNYANYLTAQRLQGATDSEIKNNAYSALQQGRISGDELVNILNQLEVQV